MDTGLGVLAEQARKFYEVPDSGGQKAAFIVSLS